METTTETIEKRRLIVLLPDTLAGNLDLAYKINWMAAREQRDVLYLALLEEEDQRLTVSRRMATMKAATGSEQIIVYSKLISRGDWLNALRENYAAGDEIVCQDEQTVKTGLLRTVPMSVYLEGTLRMPNRSLSGFYHPWRIQARQWLLGLLFWVGCLAILGAFTLLEIQIDNDLQGVARSMLLVLAIIFEFGTLSVWSRLPRI